MSQWTVSVRSNVCPHLGGCQISAIISRMQWALRREHQQLPHTALIECVTASRSILRDCSAIYRLNDLSCSVHIIFSWHKMPLLFEKNNNFKINIFTFLTWFLSQVLSSIYIFFQWKCFSLPNSLFNKEWVSTLR